jgi:3',5'-cyclic AMP phosphodiesterase CpdA
MRGLCAAVVLLGCTSAWAATALTVGPYVQDVRADGFTVAFETAADAAAEVRAGDVTVATRGTRHEAVLRGLIGVTGGRVRYRVVVDGRDAGGGEVALAGDARTLDFVVYGDTRNGTADEPALVRLAMAQHPDLVLHTGDVAPTGEDLPGWLGFFSGEAALLRDVPVYPTLGNHELFHDGQAATWRRFFVLPDEGRQLRYYEFRFGPALFLVLDGNAPSPAQTAWLRARLAAAAEAHVPHVFAMVHQPPLSVGGHCGAALAQAEWVALFEQYRVRAVFAGHDHAYERMERRGVRYFVSGGGGAPVYSESDTCAPFDRAARRTYRAVHHLLGVHIDGARVEVAALPVDGGPPLEVTRFAADEPLFAMSAPPLAPATETPSWTLAGGAIVFLLLGLLIRRRRAR